MTREDLGLDDDARVDLGGTPRAIRARTGGPNRRAVVGGILVAGATLGLLAIGQLSNDPEPRPWLVVSESIAQGQRIAVDDLALAPMDLHPGTAARAIDDPDIVIGKVALVPMQPGDLVQSSMIADASVDRGDSSARRVGLELDSADALNGELSTGMRVDVVTTDATEEPITIARDALVTGIADDAGEGVGRRDGVRITIEIADLETAELVVGASKRDDITLIAGSSRGG